MAHPKKRQTRAKRNKRRSHIKLRMPQIAIDPVTKEAHLYHRAHWHDGKLYYRGKVLYDPEAGEQ